MKSTISSSCLVTHLSESAVTSVSVQHRQLSFKRMQKQNFAFYFHKFTLKRIYIGRSFIGHSLLTKLWFFHLVKWTQSEEERGANKKINTLLGTMYFFSIFRSFAQCSSSSILLCIPRDAVALSIAHICILICMWCSVRQHPQFYADDSQTVQNLHLWVYLISSIFLR